ncbi:MAG: ABC transporter ATP-binding protein [Peptococcaceae bacterium]|nr:ABC transporter ATP-binding protein [Peptococcaceae bacterium]
MKPFGVDVRNLGKTYNPEQSLRYRRGKMRNEVLRNVSFTCPQGAFMSIVGPSGCGKTTLLRCMVGLEEVSEGEIFVEGTLVSGPDYNRAMVFQEPRLFPWLTVAGNVAFGLTGRIPRAEVRTLVEEKLDFIGLSDYARSYPRHLSGGMAQRVALARALAWQSPVLLMDEPLSALDIRTRSRLQEDVLALWQRTGKTVLLVTHDISEALLLSQRVFVLGNRPARILQELSVDLSYPRDPGSSEFVELQRLIKSFIRDASGDAPEDALGDTSGDTSGDASGDASEGESGEN